MYEVDDKSLTKAIQKYDLPEVVLRSILARKIKYENIQDFIDPKIKNLMPDPLHFMDMEKASLHIINSIKANKKIAVFGDYDVDGATSSSLLKRFFSLINQEVLIHIPDRFKDGYGPTPEAMIKLKSQGIDLCITVDCGISSFDAVNKANEIGMEVIIIDHHLSSKTIPDAIAVVNPNRFDETIEYKYLAAVGVCFLLIVAINNMLKKLNYFVENSIEKPDLLNFLDIVALGTVCDSVPLKDINRAFVSQGLKIMAKGKNLGIKALFEVSNIKDKPTEYHLGFSIGPRINAGGRIGNSIVGAKLLSSNNAEEAKNFAINLENFNVERRRIENELSAEAEVQAEKLMQENTSILFIKGYDWNQGVTGIIASRINDKYNIPTAVISINTDTKIAKASSRSILGIDLGQAVLKAKEEGLLISGGGHAMAAGFTLKEEKIEELHEYLQNFLSVKVKEHKKRKIFIDSIVSLGALNMNFAEKFQIISPFGNENPEPRICICDVHAVNAGIVGNNHVKCMLSDNVNYIKAISFRSLNTKIGKILLSKERIFFSVVGKISISTWNNRKNLSFIIEDIGLSSSF